MTGAREMRRRDDRRVELSLKDELTPGEQAELVWLEGWHARTWNALPRQITSLRNKLDRLQAFAEHLGVGF